MKKMTLKSKWNREILKNILVSGDMPLDLNEIYQVRRTTINGCLEKMSSPVSSIRSPAFDPPGVSDQDSWYSGIPLVIRRKYQRRKTKGKDCHGDEQVRQKKSKPKSRTRRVSYTVSQPALDRNIAKEFGYHRYFSELTRYRRADSECRARNMNTSYVVAAMNVIGTKVLPEEKFMGDLMDHALPYSFSGSSDVFYLMKEIRYLNSDEASEALTGEKAESAGRVRRQIFQSKCIGLWMAPCNVNYAVYNFEDQPNYWQKSAESRAVTNMRAFIGNPRNTSDRNRDVTRAIILGRGYREIIRQLNAEIEIQKINLRLLEAGARLHDLRSRYNNRFKISDTVYREVYYVPHADCKYLLPLFRLMVKDPESGTFRIREIIEEFFMEKLNIESLYGRGRFEISDNTECEGGQAFILRIAAPGKKGVQEIHLLGGAIIHYESALYYRLRLDLEKEGSQNPTRLIIGCLDSQRAFYETLFEDYVGENVVLKTLGSAEELYDFAEAYIEEEFSGSPGKGEDVQVV